MPRVPDRKTIQKFLDDVVAVCRRYGGFEPPRTPSTRLGGYQDGGWRFSTEDCLRVIEGLLGVRVETKDADEWWSDVIIYSV